MNPLKDLKLFENDIDIFIGFFLLLINFSISGKYFYKKGPNMNSFNAQLTLDWKQHRMLEPEFLKTD